LLDNASFILKRFHAWNMKFKRTNNDYHCVVVGSIVSPYSIDVPDGFQTLAISRIITESQL
jgi:hypothetical protein